MRAWNKGKKTGPRLKETKKKISKALKGKKKPPFTKEHRKNIGKAGIGRKHSIQWREIMRNKMKGRISPMKGKKQSKKFRELSSKRWKKERNPNWKGGITPIVENIRRCFKYRQWRSDIFTRDDFICVLCGKKSGWLEADHYPKRFSDIIKEYQIKTLKQALECEELWNINNGRTLCRKCHIGTR